MRLGMSQKFELLQLQLQNNMQMHLICMLPLFDLTLQGLNTLREYLGNLTPEEVEAIGSASGNGNGKKAFHDYALESLIEETGARNFRGPDLKVNLSNEGQLSLEYLTDADYEKFQPSFSDEDSLIRESKTLLRNISWVGSATKEVYSRVLNHQADYLRTGNCRDLKVLTQADLAGKMNISDSTVSRLVQDKTIIAPDGYLMPLQSMFIRGEEYRNKLKFYEIFGPMLKKGTYPNSDENAMIMFEAMTGIRLARRTISKYRSDMEDYMNKGD